MEVKTNKEYEAILKEIEWSEETISQREEEIIRLLEEADVVRSEIPQAEREFEEEKKRYQDGVEEIKRGQEALERKVQAWLQEKEGIIKELDPPLYSRYLRLKERRGTAVVLVKDEACQGCYVHIPPQLYNEVLKNNKIIACPNCQRILYWEEGDEGGG